MKAVVCRSGAPEVVDLPEPLPRADEAVVRVSVAGICGTDVEIARGYMGFDGVPGHEFVGIVEESPDPSWLGRRVVGEINVPCGSCKLCAERLPRHCPNRTVLGIVGRDGAFAERLALPVGNLHPVPDIVPDEAAVLVEPLAAAYEILEQIPVTPVVRALVLGDGRLGQLCAEALATTGVSPLVCGRHPEKLGRLGRRGFATTLADDSLAREFDLVVEATGSPTGLERAVSLVKPRGTIALKSTYHGQAPFEFARVVIDEITVIGSRCGPFAPALERLSSDPSIVDGMVSARFALDEAREAFAWADRSDALKVLIIP